MRIIGIDPGYAIVGYAILDFVNNIRILKKCGVIETSSKSNFSDRLIQIYEELQIILNEYNPDCASVESLFFQNNQKTAIYVSQARGVILFCLRRNNVEIFEFTPLQAKSVITGFGRATKSQMIYMTQKFLNLKDHIKPDDAADACALALTLTFSLSGIQKFIKNTEGAK